MTWPTTTISTANLDSGLDNPGLAREQLLNTVDAVNNIITEFGDVQAATAQDAQLLQYSTGTDSWTSQFPELHRYTERTTALGNQSGAVNLDFNNGNTQTITATGNLTFAFTNWPATGTVTVILTHDTTARTVTWPTGTLFPGGDKLLSLADIPGQRDMLIISRVPTVGYIVSILVGLTV